MSASGGAGNFNSAYESGSVSNGRLGFEYRPNPNIGFGLGLNSSNYDIKSASNNDLLFDLIYYSSLFGSDSSFLTTMLLLDLLSTSGSVGFSSTTLDLAFNYHFLGDGTLDPYIGIGIVGGSCGGGASCTITGGEARLGMQFNFDSLFFFLQGQYQALTFAGGGSSASANNSMAALGVGVRF